MPLFNESIVTKKLQNIIDMFFQKSLKNKQRHYPIGYFYCTIGIFNDHSKTFFPVQNNFPIER